MSPRVQPLSNQVTTTRSRFGTTSCADASSPCWGAGLHPHGAVPPGVPVDRLRVRRPDHSDLELAVPQLHQRPDRPQPLRHVRLLPRQGGSRGVRVAGSNRAGLGHRRPSQEERRARRGGSVQQAHAQGDARRRPVRRWRRGGQVRPRGSRQGRQLGGVPPVPSAHRLRRG